MAQSLTQVYYFVPEDAESGKELNCFVVRRAADQITLGVIRDEFPLPGDYHFRIQYFYQTPNGPLKVYLDLPSDDMVVPSSGDEIIIKAMRNSWHYTGAP